MNNNNYPSPKNKYKNKQKIGKNDKVRQVDMAARETTQERKKKKHITKTHCAGLTMVEHSRDGRLLLPSYNVFFFFLLFFIFLLLLFNNLYIHTCCFVGCFVLLRFAVASKCGREIKKNNRNEGGVAFE